MFVASILWLYWQGKHCFFFSLPRRFGGYKGKVYNKRVPLVVTRPFYSIYRAWEFSLYIATAMKMESTRTYTSGAYHYMYGLDTIFPCIGNGAIIEQWQRRRLYTSLCTKHTRWEVFNAIAVFKRENNHSNKLYWDVVIWSGEKLTKTCI